MTWHLKLLFTLSLRSSKLRWISPWTSSSGSTLVRFIQLSSPVRTTQRDTVIYSYFKRMHKECCKQIVPNVVRRTTRAQVGYDAQAPTWMSCTLTSQPSSQGAWPHSQGARSIEGIVTGHHIVTKKFLSKVGIPFELLYFLVLQKNRILSGIATECSSFLYICNRIYCCGNRFCH